MDEGIVERCENTGDTENEFTWTAGLAICIRFLRELEFQLTFPDTRAKVDVLLRWADCFLWRHVDGC